ncbi:alpha/beta hydrolase [Phytoactinopolyspora halotolerans]|uniref:Alpha/beta hydrolase n=2 Tax=Phytoactinopolyspora halotolerans TaxID=1981512 RepID=A0A6L9SD63_9ACTN|nr:alpha/beta hydrolase [Phytoactinopolyspora halotolerans]
MRELTVPVDGGELAALEWWTAEAQTAGWELPEPVRAGSEKPDDAEPAREAALPVVGVHGITANAAAFGRIGHELGGRRRMIAPDLRGRARSADVSGPYGLDRHAEDLIALLDHLGIDRAVLLGHSMGAFVSCLTAVRHPERVAAVVLVDGGLALPVPPDTEIEAVLGPAMTRLSMTFADLDECRGFWQAHPAFAGRWNSYVENYIRRDLVGPPPLLRSACRADAVRIDGAQVLQDTETLAAVTNLPCPARLLWASRGLMDESPGLYTAELLAGLETVTARELVGENHYSVMFSSAAAEIAAEVDAVAEQAVDAER